MKIMLVSSNMGIGGASIQWINRIRRMTHHTFHILVLNQCHDRTKKELTSLPNTTLTDLNEPSRHYSLSDSFDIINKIKNEILKNKPDLVIARSWDSAYFTSYAAEKTNKRMIVYHGGEVQHTFENESSERIKFVSHAHRYASAVISNSQKALNTFLPFPDIDKNKLILIEQGAPKAIEYTNLIDLRRSAREQLGLSQNDFAIGCYAHIRSSKQQHLIIELANKIQKYKKYENVKFFFWGETLGERDYYNKFLALVSDCNNVVFGSEIEHFSPLLSALDLHVLLSLHEGMPNSVLETMAYGVPQLLSNIYPHRLIHERAADATTLTTTDPIDLILNIDGLIEQNEPYENRVNHTRSGLRNFKTHEESDKDWEKLFKKVMKPKISVLFPSVQVGGTELTWCRRLVALRENGYDCQAIILQDKKDNVDQIMYLEANGITVKIMDTPPRVQLAIDFFKPDVIFALMSLGRDFIADVDPRGAKVVGFQGSETSSLKGKSLAGMRKCNLFVASTDYIADQFAVYGVPTTYINTGTEKPTLPDKKQLREKNNINEKAILIGTVGNIRPVKNTVLFLHAARIVHEKRPNTIFYVAGSDRSDYANQLKQEIRRLKAENYFVLLGQTKPDHDILRCLDITVNTSKSEAYALGLRERMLDAIPAVVTNNKGNSSVVKHKESGYVCEHTAHDLADAIIQLVDNPSLRTKMGDYARKDISNRFSIEKEIQEYMGLIENLLEN